MKDNFDLIQFLVENKMTESSRGDVRKHFESVLLNEHVMFFGAENEEEGPAALEIEEEEYTEPEKLDEKDAEEVEESVMPTIEEIKYNKDDLYRELVGFQTKYGDEKGTRIFQIIYPDVDINRITPRFAKKNREFGDKQDQIRLNLGRKGDRVDTFVPHEEAAEDMEAVVSEANYTADDFDEDYEDDTVRAALQDKAAEKAFNKAYRPDEEEEDITIHREEDQEGEDIPVDDTELDAEDSFDLKVFKKNASHVEPLINLTKFFDNHKNYKVATLVSAVNSAVDYLSQYENPKKGILYLIPQSIGYKAVRNINDAENAIVAVYRNPIGTDQTWTYTD